MTKKGKLQFTSLLACAVIIALIIYKVPPRQASGQPQPMQPIELAHPLVDPLPIPPQKNVWMTVFVHGSITI
jgi:hypothetical protein